MFCLITKTKITRFSLSIFSISKKHTATDSQYLQFSKVMEVPRNHPRLVITYCYHILLSIRKPKWFGVAVFEETSPHSLPRYKWFAKVVNIQNRPSVSKCSSRYSKKTRPQWFGGFAIHWRWFQMPYVYPGLCVCMCLYICIYIYIHICVFIYVYIYIYDYICIYVLYIH